MSQLIPAVGYARRSSNNESQEFSIPDQIAAVEKYAAEKGYRIQRWYIDDAISGDNTKSRFEFLRMMADAQDHRDFDAIVCWDRSRFGRFDSIEAGYYIHPLRMVGVKLATVMDGPIDWNDSSGRMIGSIEQEGKHKQIIDLSGNVVRGQLGAMKAGSWVGSPPYAYRIEGKRKEKKLVIDNMGQARIVQQIFREFVNDGRSMKSIADRLNDAGVVSPSGKVGELAWRCDTVKFILSNPAYTGDYAGSRTCYGKYHTARNGSVVPGADRRRKSKEEWIIKPDAHDPIIDRETFAKAEALLAGRKTYRGRYTLETNPYILTGLCVCGRCGASLKGMMSGSSVRRRYYECNNRAYNGAKACLGTTVREDRILRSIADHLIQEFFEIDGVELAWKADRKELKPGDLPQAFAKVKALVSPPKQFAIDRQQLAKQVKAMTAKLEKAQGNLVLLDREDIPTAQKVIRELRAELERAQAELKRNPPSEKDINSETLEVLRNLYWLAVWFRVAAESGDDEGLTERERIDKRACEPADGRTGWLSFDDPKALAAKLRPLVRKIAGITIHTKIIGRGTGIRHVFEGGEIAFKSVGRVWERVNPRLAV